MYIPLGERELAKEIEQRGIAIGMEKGMEKGEEKGEEKIARMVRNLIANGISPDIIAQSAGLPVEQVRMLIS